MPSPKPHSAVLLKTKDPLPYPVIEILGDLDVGKCAVADAVARKLKGNCLKFPMFNAPKSLTGLGLMTLLGQNTRMLEANPQWWSLIYAANMWENHQQVLEAKKFGPVVIVNWVTACRTYYKLLADIDSRATYALVRDLTPSDFRFVLRGEPFDFPGNFGVQFSSPFRRRLSKAMQEITHATHIHVDYRQQTTQTVNRVAQTIVDSILKKRPDLKTQAFSYTPGHFATS